MNQQQVKRIAKDIAADRIRSDGDMGSMDDDPRVVAALNELALRLLRGGQRQYEHQRRQRFERTGTHA